MVASLMIRPSFSRLPILLHMTRPSRHGLFIMIGNFSFASALIQHNGTRIETVEMRLTSLVLDLVDRDEFGLDLFFLLQQCLIFLALFHMVEELLVGVDAVADFA